MGDITICQSPAQITGTIQDFTHYTLDSGHLSILTVYKACLYLDPFALAFPSA